MQKLFHDLSMMGRKPYANDEGNCVIYRVGDDKQSDIFNLYTFDLKHARHNTCESNQQISS